MLEVSVLEQSVKLKETLDGAYDDVDDAEAVDRRLWAGIGRSFGTFEGHAKTESRMGLSLRK